MSESESETETTTTNSTKKERRSYIRCGNSVLCIFCNTYHQKKRNGKCNNFQKELPLFTDYIRDNDASENIKEKINLETGTEVSLRRIMAFMMEQKDQFRLWSSQTDFELGPERLQVSRLVQQQQRPLPVEKKKDPVIPADEEEEISYIPSGENKGPAPHLLSYEYLKNLNDIKY
jgi:hypothetical protein